MNFDNPVYKKTTDQLIIRTTSNTSIASVSTSSITMKHASRLGHYIFLLYMNKTTYDTIEIHLLLNTNYICTYDYCISGQ